MISRRSLLWVAWLPLMAAGCYGAHLGEPIPDAGETAGHTGHTGGGAGHGGGGTHAGTSSAGHAGGNVGTSGSGSQVEPDGGGAGTNADLDAGDAGQNAPHSTEPNLRVAFLGDQGVNADARAVLQLVKREGAAFVIHPGDIGYGATPGDWEAMIDDELGPDYPYFIAVGNHDVPDWPGSTGFQARLNERLLRTKGASCFGDLGVNSRCSYRGLVFVLSGVGSFGADHEAYLDSALSTDDVFRLCVWHKNQHDMQTEVKTDEVGWEAYRICQAHGAPIISAHAHSYSRTFTLADVGNALTDHGARGAPDLLDVAAGRTFVVVTALGGASTRTWNGEDNAWWSTVYTGNYQLENAVEVGTNNVIEFGALFIDFHVDGDPYKAHAYFKTTSDQVIDDFTIVVAK